MQRPCDPHAELHGTQHIPSDLAGDGPTLVLSGGGALGAYQVGVLKALSRGHARGGDGLSFDPSLIVGTSVGTFNAAFLVAQGDVSFVEAVDRLEHVWRRLIANQGRGNGVYRLRFHPRDYFRASGRHPGRAIGMLESDLIVAAKHLLHSFRQSSRSLRPGLDLATSLLDLRRLVSLDPFARTIRRTIDFRRLATSPRRLLVTAMGIRVPKGRLVCFEGRNPIWPRQGSRLVCGATAIPGVFSPIRCDRQILVDPAAITNTSIGPAVRAGAREIHLVAPWAGEGSRTAVLRTGTLDSLYGAQATTWISQAFMNLRDVYFANNLWRWVEAGDDVEHRQRQLESHGVRLPRQGRIGTRLYAPSESLGLELWELLNFSADRIAHLIDLGYRDTCARSAYDPGRSLDQFRSLSLFEAMRFSGDWVG